MPLGDAVGEGAIVIIPVIVEHIIDGLTLSRQKQTSHNGIILSVINALDKRHTGFLKKRTTDNPRPQLMGDSIMDEYASQVALLFATHPRMRR